MDVGIVTAPLDFGPSGPNVYLENLCHSLLDLESPDLNLSLIHYEESDRELYDRATEIILSRKPCAFERGIAGLDLDLLHYNYIPYRRPLVFGLSVKTVVTIHGDLAFMLPEYAPWKFRYISKPVLKMYGLLGLLDQIDSYITVSETLAANIEDALSIPPEKLTTVYSGVDELYRPVANPLSELEATYGITGPYLLNVNNYMRKKNRDTLLRAFAQLRRSHPNLTLVLAGGGWHESEMDETILTLGIRSAVTDLGFVPEKHLPMLYSGAKALVNPTLHETFGLTNLEAMACGCPVVTSDRFAVPEIVDDGAVLVGDPLRPNAVARATDELLTDDAKRIELAKRARDRANEFSWEQTAEGVLDVYHKTLSQ
ncbi:glycosyltransferase family 4 protein [Halopenitus persicus]|uniref:glycosyltransferase family 4 protein n=1 Tax=Halopenitus persicus TaxID=1048396 RepID=UPI0015616285|nr:glycosyltransferase family 1 protein [Halopenitus persicus]